jgi:hypothetical protein
MKIERKWKQIWKIKFIFLIQRKQILNQRKIFSNAAKMQILKEMQKLFEEFSPEGRKLQRNYLSYKHFIKLFANNKRNIYLMPIVL